MRLVDPGNIVRASDQGSIAILVQTQPAAVLFTLPAHTLDDVREAQKRGPVEVTAYDQDNRSALSTGTLATIDNVIDQATASYRLKAMFANEDEKLWPGEFVNARLLVETRNNALVVPNTRDPARAARPVHLGRDATTTPRRRKPIEVGAVGRRPHHRHVGPRPTATASSPAASTSCRRTSPVSVIDQPATEAETATS